MLDLLKPATKSGHPVGEIAREDERVLIAEVQVIAKGKGVTLAALLEELVKTGKLTRPESAGKGIYRLPNDDQLIRVIQ